MRFKVKSATGSHRSVETPSINIAMVRCSSSLRSVHEMPSIAHLARHGIPQPHDSSRRLKID